MIHPTILPVLSKWSPSVRMQNAKLKTCTSRVKKSQHILDHMGTTELAANLFRSTQAEDKLRRDNVRGKDAANEVHYQAGVIVRRAIAELGGTMPEDLPTADSIKKLERAEKKRLGAGKTPKSD